MYCLNPKCSHAETNARREGEAVLRRADEVEAGASPHGLSADELRERGGRLMAMFRTLRALRQRKSNDDSLLEW
jgi:hypothetical protein